ncbi:MAG TPA: hypothetical protein VGV61_05850, partial [Thermoanaerobaculia bacterium]|nr:hypothetical protein [Thermoanaerobaculia bacterium]
QLAGALSPSPGGDEGEEQERLQKALRAHERDLLVVWKQRRGWGLAKASQPQPGPATTAAVTFALRLKCDPEH